MKIILSIILLFLPCPSYHHQIAQPTAFKLTTFKNVPDDLMGCGDDCYLSEKDKKNDLLFCRTNYITALIYINGKPVRLNANEKKSHGKNEQVYNLGQIILSIKRTYRKTTGDEDYLFKGIVTITSDAKIMFQQNVTGEGGC